MYSTGLLYIEHQAMPLANAISPPFSYPLHIRCWHIRAYSWYTQGGSAGHLTHLSRITCSPTVTNDTNKGQCACIVLSQVDIGNTTCGLMCFVLARTLMSDQLDCTCSPAILAQIHVIAQNGWKHHLAPASAGILITYGAGSVLLAMLAAQLGYLSGGMKAVRGMWRRGRNGGAGGSVANGIMVVDSAAGFGPHGSGRTGKGGVPLGEGRVRSVEQVEASLQMV